MQFSSRSWQKTRLLGVFPTVLGRFHRRFVGFNKNEAPCSESPKQGSRYIGACFLAPYSWKYPYQGKCPCSSSSTTRRVPNWALAQFCLEVWVREKHPLVLSSCLCPPSPGMPTAIANSGDEITRKTNSRQKKARETLGSRALGSGALGSGALGSGALGSGALGSGAFPRPQSLYRRRQTQLIQSKAVYVLVL